MAENIIQLTNSTQPVTGNGVENKGTSAFESAGLLQGNDGFRGSFSEPLALYAFAILHKPSGHFLPQGKRRRGFTHDEPGPGIPRLFLKETAARAALRCWLKGEWEEVTDTDMYGDVNGVYPVPPKTPNPNRKAEEMQVVRLRISLTARQPYGARP